MKVKLLKNHLANKIGDVMEVTPERARYFLWTKVAELVKTKVDKK